MCDCYQVGGPFIAEDPDCPVHGTEAQASGRDARQLASRADQTTDISELREIVRDLAALVPGY